MFTLILEINWGNQQLGYEVALRIEKNGKLIERILGKLPPDEDVVNKHYSWESTYRDRGFGSYRRPQPIEAEPTNISIVDLSQDLKNSINDWLHPSRDSEFREIRDKLVGILDNYDPIQLIIQTDDIHHWRYHWHLWDILKPDKEVEVTLSLSNYGVKNKKIKPRQQVRILVILGDSTGIDNEKDLKIINEKIPNAYIKSLRNPTKKEVINCLWDKESWDILFFAGHSFSQEKDGQGYFYISETEKLTIEELKQSLNHAIKGALKLAIFNSCDGSALARALAGLQIPATIVMKERVPDLVAQNFLEYFLDAFVKKGKPLSASLHEARARLSEELDNEHPCASWLPQLSRNPVETELTWQKLLGQPSHSGENTQISTVSQYKIKATILLITGCIITYTSCIVMSDVFNQIGGFYLNKGDLSSARFYFNLAFYLNHNNPKALNNQGLVDQILGEDEQARQKFRDSKIAGDPAGCNNEVYDKITNGEYEKAKRLLPVCLSQATTKIGKSYIFKNWGLLNLKQNQLDEAENNFRAAIIFKPTQAAAHCLLGQILEAKGNKQDSLTQWSYCQKYTQDSLSEERDWKIQAEQRIAAIWSKS